MKKHTTPELSTVMTVIEQCENCGLMAKLKTYKDQGALKGLTPTDLDRLASARFLITGEGTDTSCSTCVTVMLGHINEYLTKQGAYPKDEVKNVPLNKTPDDQTPQQ